MIVLLQLVTIICKAAREVRSAKFNYEKKLADNVKFDAKSFYAYVRSRCKSRSGIGVLSRDDGELVESPEEVAEEFNDYFSSVFSREDLVSSPVVDGGPAGGGLFDMVVSREKVRDMLRKLRADKAPGVDELSPRLLLHFPDEILVPVCMLFEKSPREGFLRIGGRQMCQFIKWQTGERPRTTGQLAWLVSYVRYLSIPANISKLKSGRLILAAFSGQEVGFGEGMYVPLPMMGGS